MASPRRDLESSHFFHVSNRGNDRQDIFSHAFDWECFEENVARVCERYSMRVIVFAWMTNHFHMIVEIKDPAELPAAMRDFQSRYAAGYNLRTERTGSLFERPYFSKPICDDGYFLQAARYIHRNPIDIVGAGRIVAYLWSSLGVFLGVRSAEPWHSPERLSGLIDADRYLEQLRGPHVWDRLPIDELPPLVGTTVELLSLAVASVSDRRGGTHRSERRAVVLLLAARTRAATPVELAECFSIGSSMVRKIQRAARVAHATDPLFASFVAESMTALANGPARTP